MGIGRFAFTPILPMMQADHGITVADGGWLASANYVGYLAGSLFAMRVHIAARTAVRVGLVLIAACTLAMAVPQPFVAWLALRIAAGFASALVLIVASAWILPRLPDAAREHLSGVVYAGVGAGVMLAGLACVVLQRMNATSDVAWIALGLAAVAVTGVVWPVLGHEAASNAGHVAADASADSAFDAPLVFCYAALGLGYIIPATFLPVMAKQMVSDPAWFAWVWPMFGAAAMASTVLASRLTRRFGNRNVWSASNVVMATGVLVPAAWPTLAGIAIAALFVGATFMVITMTGIGEARRVAGSHARALIAAMTSAFAIGQIIGPLLVAGLVHVPGGFAWALCLSALPLLAAAYVLKASNRSSGAVR
jgi:MFS family permease